MVEANIQLEDSTLRAPYDGIIAQRFVEEGQNVRAKQPIVRFQDVDEIDIAVSLEAIGRSSVTWGFRFEHAGRWVAQGRVVAVRCRLRPGLPPTAVAIPVEILGRLAPYHDPTDAPAESDAIPSALPEDPIGH